MPKGVYERTEKHLLATKNNGFQLGHTINVGVKRSEETLKRMSQAQKGKKGHPNLRKGLIGVFSKETLEKMSRAHSGKILTLAHRLKIKESSPKGKNSHLWKGGITPINKVIRGSFEFRLWRTSVYERDDYTCQHCKAKSGKGRTIYLNAHHIKEFSKYPKLRFEISNGATLCRECHNKLHREPFAELQQT